ncbi:MAG: flagellar basal body P-ring formation chaperone FlgA [Verrucomicrobiia bacterium]|jgi:flagella basal body P-ring formation protein FlgA
MKKIFTLILLAAAPASFGALADLKPAITAALTEELELDGGELMLTSVRPLPKVEVPEGFPLIVKITQAPAGGLGAFMTIKFSVTVGDQPRGVHTAFFKAALLREVWVATKYCNRLASLDQVSLKRKKVDVINLRTGIWEGDKLTDDLQIIQAVPAGTVLQPRHVRRRPVVLRNQTVQAVIRHKALHIRLPVVALEDGAPGDVIRLRNPKSYKELRGTVMNGNTVSIKFISSARK